MLAHGSVWVQLRRQKPTGNCDKRHLGRAQSHIEMDMAILSYDIETQELKARYDATDTWMRRNGELANCRRAGVALLRRSCARARGFEEFCGVRWDVSACTWKYPRNFDGRRADVIWSKVPCSLFCPWFSEWLKSSRAGGWRPNFELPLSVISKSGTLYAADL